MFFWDQPEILFGGQSYRSYHYERGRTKKVSGYEDSGGEGKASIFIYEPLVYLCWRRLNIAKQKVDFLYTGRLYLIDFAPSQGFVHVKYYKPKHNLENLLEVDACTWRVMRWTIYLKKNTSMTGIIKLESIL